MIGGSSTHRTSTEQRDLFVALATLVVAALLLFGSSEPFDPGWPDMAAGIGAFAMVLFRNRAPFVLLGIALIWTATHVAVLDRPTPTVFAAMVLLYTVGTRLERRQSIALGVAIAGSLYVLSLLNRDLQPGDSRAVIAVAWTAGAVGIADATRSWNRYREVADEQVRSALLAAEATARQQVAEERMTIARELHDLLAHNLSVMNVQTGAALHLLRSNSAVEAEAALVTARDAGRSVLDELSGLVGVLRHDGDAPTTSLPTVDQLPDLVESIRSAGLAVTWSRSGSPVTLAPAVSLAAYRIAQEALTNAAKHGTGSADFTTEWDPAGLSISVSNLTLTSGGEGHSGHGLQGMHERTSAHGGSLTVTPGDGRFEVEAWLPAAREEDRS